MIGTQAKSRDQTPYLWKYNWLLFSLSSEIGNHRLFLNINIFLPRYQLSTEPEILPILATIKSSKMLKLFDKYIVDIITSDEKGRNVAAKKLKNNSCKYPSNINKIILI